MYSRYKRKNPTANTKSSASSVRPSSQRATLPTTSYSTKLNNNKYTPNSISRSSSSSSSSISNVNHSANVKKSKPNVINPVAASAAAASVDYASSVKSDTSLMSKSLEKLQELRSYVMTNKCMLSLWIGIGFLVLSFLLAIWSYRMVRSYQDYITFIEESGDDDSVGSAKYEIYGQQNIMLFFSLTLFVLGIALVIYHLFSGECDGTRSSISSSK